MTPLPLDSLEESDGARGTERWVDALEREDYAGAYAMTNHDPYYAWTPDLLRQVIAGYGTVAPPRHGAAHVVRRPRPGGPSGPSPFMERWGNPAEQRTGDSIGELAVPLPLDGAWSDLTATFGLRLVEDGRFVLVLQEVHVF